MKRQVQLTAVAAIAWTAAAGIANAQVLSGGVAPLQNAAAAGARAPGQMVTNSFGRLEQVMVEPIRSFSEITEAETPRVGEVFRSQAAIVLVQQLTIAIDLFVDALLARSGITTPSDGSRPGDGGRDAGGGRSGGGKKAQEAPR